MPFAARIVTPVKLCRGSDIEHSVDNISGRELWSDGVLDKACHHGYVGLLQQLSCVVRQADEIFGEVAKECQAVVSRSEKLRERTSCLSTRLGQLNARQVKVPVGDLTAFSKQTEHYVAEHGFDSFLFVPASRPEFVNDVYQVADVNPVHVIRRCNIYRTDGKTGSKIFSVPSVFQDEKDNIMSEMEDKQPPHVESFEREVRQIRAAERRPRSMSHLDTLVNTAEVPLPTPEDRMRQLSRSQPVTLVPIDITGTGFDRMCEFRASQKSIAGSEEVCGTGTRSRRKRHKRRQTVCGVPGIVFDEVNHTVVRTGSDILRTRSASRERWERPRSAALDYYAPKTERRRQKENKRIEQMDDDEEGSLARSCSFRRSLRSLFKGKRSKSTDLWVEGRPMSPGPPVVDIGMPPLSRSTSLPRSLKSSALREYDSPAISESRSASTEGRLDSTPDNNDFDLRPQSIDSSKGSNKKKKKRKLGGLFRSLSHLGSLHRGTTTFLDGRAGSADLPPNLPKQYNSKSIYKPMSSSPSTESLTSTSTNTEASSKTDNRRTINVHCPNKPWTKPFSRVQLRGSKVEREEGNSSSGHWSASSGSARQSFESEYARTSRDTTRLMNQSFDKDSAVSLNIHPERLLKDFPHGVKHVADVTVHCEDTSKSVKSNFTKQEAEEWLSQMKMPPKGRLQKRRNVRSWGSSSDDSSVHHALTTHILRQHDSAYVPYSDNITLDDESSLYSVDQEGFFTSMHKDSGIRRSTSSLSRVDKHKHILVNDSSSSTLNSSETSIQNCRRVKGMSSFSLISRLSGGKKTLRTKKLKQVPPTPPPRSSTLIKNNFANDTTDLPPPPSPDQLMSMELPPPPTTRELQELSQPPKSGGAVRIKQKKPSIPAWSQDSSPESDVETVYARLKVKTNICSSGIPCMVSVTPTNSDDETDSVIDSYRAADGTTNGSYYPSDSLQSSKSAPGTLQEIVLISLNNNVPTNECTNKPQKSLDDSIVSEASLSKTLDESDCDGFSTWPRSPKFPKTSNLKLESILKTGTEKKVKPTKTLNFAPAVFNTVNVRKGMALPEASSPDNFLDRRMSTTTNTFQGPYTELVPVPVLGKDGKSSGEFSSPAPILSSFAPLTTPSTSCSSLPSSGKSDETRYSSSISGDDAPPLPERYLHKLKVKPGTTTDDEKTKKKREIIYANLPKPQVSSGPKCEARFPFSFITKGKLDVVKETSSGESSVHNTPSKPSSLPLNSANSSPESLEVATANGLVEPMAAHARLVISSPVADKAHCVANPHKRSMCSPVTMHDLMKYASYAQEDSWYNTLPRPPHADAAKRSAKLSPRDDEEDTGDITPKALSPVLDCLPRSSTMFDFPHGQEQSNKRISQPLYPTLSSMKHSISFPLASSDHITTNYGRSWYDGTDQESSAADSNQSTPTPCKANFSAVNEAQLLCNGARRDSNASSLSTDSSGSGFKKFASIRKPSLTSWSGSMASGSSCETTDANTMLPVPGQMPPKPPAEFSLKRSVSEPEKSSGTLFKFRGFQKPSISVDNDVTTSVEANSVSNKKQKVASCLHEGEIAVLEPVAQEETTPEKKVVEMKQMDNKLSDTITVIKAAKTRGRTSKPAHACVVYPEGGSTKQETNITDANLCIPPEQAEGADAKTNTVPCPSQSSVAPAIFHPKGPVNVLKSRNQEIDMSASGPTQSLENQKSSNLAVTENKRPNELPALKSWPGVSNNVTTKTAVAPRALPKNHLTQETNLSENLTVSKYKQNDTPKKNIDNSNVTNGAISSLRRRASASDRNETSRLSVHLPKTPPGLDRQMSGSSLSLGACSIGLNRSLGSLLGSSLSLACSTDSLASTGSLNAERTRSAKLAFLSKENSGSTSSIDDKFAKHTVGHKRLSASRGSLHRIHDQPAFSTVPEEKESMGLPTAAPVKGRFVSSVIGQLHKRSADSLSSTSSCSTTSSGLGTSMPNSPNSTPNTPINPKDINGELGSTGSSEGKSPLSKCQLFTPSSKPPISKKPELKDKLGKCTSKRIVSPQATTNNSADFRAILRSRKADLKTVRPESNHLSTHR